MEKKKVETIESVPYMITQCQGAFNKLLEEDAKQREDELIKQLNKPRKATDLRAWGH